MQTQLPEATTIGMLYEIGILLPNFIFIKVFMECSHLMGVTYIWKEAFHKPYGNGEELIMATPNNKELVTKSYTVD